MHCRPADRLSLLRITLNLSTDEFSIALDLPTRRVRRLLKPGRKPSVGLMARVRRSFPQVSPDWLLSGEGDIILPLPIAGNHIGHNTGTANQTLIFNFNGLPTAPDDCSLLIGLLTTQLKQLKSAA